MRSNLPRWLYRDKWGTYYYRGPAKDGSGRVFVNIGKVGLDEARKRWVELAPAEPDVTKNRPFNGGGYRPGVVYVLRAVGSGHFKIGFSQSADGIRRRIESLRTGCPFPIELVAHRSGTSGDEYAAHVALAKWRSHGEWFEPSPAVLQWVADYSTNSDRHG